MVTLLTSRSRRVFSRSLFFFFASLFSFLPCWPTLLVLTVQSCLMTIQLVPLAALNFIHTLRLVYYTPGCLRFATIDAKIYAGIDCPKGSASNAKRPRRFRSGAIGETAIAVQKFMPDFFSTRMQPRVLEPAN